jgi:23S rRNA (cytosine1962-C5)-methyltransferase
MTRQKNKPSSTQQRPSQGKPDFRSRNRRGGKSSGEKKDIPRSAPQALTGNVAAQPGIILKPGREKSLMRRHPWVFSGAVEFVDGAPQKGDTLAVRDSAGNFLAWTAYNPDSQITARVWSWDANETIDAAFFRKKISQALNMRRELLPSPLGGEEVGERGASNGLRLIHAESDGLPGLVVDQYGDTLVVQIGSAGAERWRDAIAGILQELCKPVCIYERSDSDSRGLEGLEPRNGVLCGVLPERVEVVEHGLRFAVDVVAGQKTGFFLDQRDNRALTETLAKDREVLNCFCYTGGFSLYALRGGAKSVLSIDASGDALRIAEQNVANNGLDVAASTRCCEAFGAGEAAPHSHLPEESDSLSGNAGRAEWQEADVFQALRKLRDQGRSFDLIILDPPKFAPTAAFAEKASRGYKDINLLAFKLLRPGGLLATYSCSGGIGEDLFQKIVAGAALDAGVDAQIVYRLHASADHPVLLSFPEGAYLKGLVLRVAG